MNKRTPNVVRKTIVMSYDNFESAIAQFLYATKTIPPSWDIISSDFNIPLNDKGMIEFDIEITQPIQRNLTVVDETYKEPEQTELPLIEVFETIHVNNP